MAEKDPLRAALEAAVFAYLKDNLRVDAGYREGYDYDTRCRTVEVRLYLTDPSTGGEKLVGSCEASIWDRG